MTTKTLPIARRMSEIEPFHVMDLLAEAKKLEAAGRDIVHMEVGEPDFLTPIPIVQAGLRALERGEIHYTPAVGIAPLREAIARFYAERRGVTIPAGRVVVTPGASGALLLTAGILIDPGSQVLIADPGYPCNRHFIRLMEGEAVRIPVGPDTGWQLTPELIEKNWTDRTVAVLVGSPSNPTGTILPDPVLKGIVDVVERLGGTLIVDEIYHGLVHEGHVSTALRFSDDVIVINSFSKYFGMTGWRLGWVVAPERQVREMDKLAQNIFLAPSTIAQHAALAAFEPETIEILEHRREEFRKRRDFLVPELRRLGFEIPVVPQGAFYIYANVANLTGDSDAFSRQLLNEAGVAITPGRDFECGAPDAHVRFACTTSVERLAEGVRRIEQWLRERR
ncbi:MAG: pyridoxal phosphate-dependent aminotransferase [Thermoanaerobaculia bacterium]